MFILCLILGKALNSTKMLGFEAGNLSSQQSYPLLPWIFWKMKLL
jgi:hypothetical protein